MVVAVAAAFQLSVDALSLVAIEVVAAAALLEAAAVVAGVNEWAVGPLNAYVEAMMCDHEQQQHLLILKH